MFGMIKLSYFILHISSVRLSYCVFVVRMLYSFYNRTKVAQFVIQLLEASEIT